MNLFIDTSVFIDVLRSKQVESSKSLFKSSQGSSNKGFASEITVAELSVGAYKSPRKDALEKTLKTFIHRECSGFEWGDCGINQKLS